MPTHSLTNREFVFDLDSTLIHSSMDMEAYEALKLYSDPKSIPLRGRVYRFDLVDVTETPGTGTVTPMWGVFRPYVFEFLQFMAHYCKKVHVWTAGQYKYGHTIKAQLFKGTFQPTTVFTYENCKMTTSSIHKPLEELYAAVAASGEEAGTTDATNTLALDDREDTFSLNPYNGIQIPPYEPELTKEGIMKEDIALLQLMCWLSLPEVVQAKDVRYLDKRYIFTTSLEEYRRRLQPVVASPPPKPVAKRSSRAVTFFPSIVHI